MAYRYTNRPSIWQGSVNVVILFFVLLGSVGAGVYILSREQAKTDELMHSLQSEQIRAITVSDEANRSRAELLILEAQTGKAFQPIPGWEVFFPDTVHDGTLLGLTRGTVAKLLGQPPILHRTYDASRQAYVETWVYKPYTDSVKAVIIQFPAGIVQSASVKEYLDSAPLGSYQATIRE